MMMRRTPILGLLLWATAAAALMASPATRAQEHAPPPAANAPVQDVVTYHSLDVAGTPLRYVATVGTLSLADNSGTVKAHYVYTAYTKEGGDPARPLTFAFNGGPGAASAYLHFGALGPHRLVLNHDGTALPPPGRTEPNPESWLAFTDLVFVDPVGTGRSRPAEIDGKPVANSEFWSVESDIAWAGRFIRQYVTHVQRWASPKFLVGESYGGFRVARLADALPERFGIGLNGVVMVSPLIDFGLSFGSDRFHVWPAALRLPSLAAVAWHHGKVGEGPRTVEHRDRFLAEVESFALAELLPGLAQGPSLPEARRQALMASVARYTGMPVELVRRANGRIGREIFLKEVLREEGKVIGRYDGSVAIVDPDPAAPRFSEADPTLEQLSAPLLTATNAYFQRELRVTEERPYVLLNRTTNGEWNWRSGRGGNAVGAAGALRAGMIANPALRVLVVHGRYDLITPYFASVHVANQMHGDAALRRNLAVHLYDAGHMMYFNAQVREALARDVAAFYASATAPRHD